MRRGNRVVVLHLAAFVATSACSDSKSASEKFVEDYAELVCPALKECCGDAWPADADCKGV